VDDDPVDLDALGECGVGAVGPGEQGGEGEEGGRGRDEETFQVEKSRR
jgi:hypothetical protein